MRRLIKASSCLVALLLAVAPIAGSKAGGFAGSPPKNLRVTGTTDWTVGLAWDRPSGKAPASYVIQCSNGRTMNVPGSQTTATFSNGFDYNRTYTFRAFAVNSTGSWSGASNQVTATLKPDTTPPGKPIVSSTGSGPTHIDLAWTSFDASPIMRYDIYVNDELWHFQVAGNAKTVVILQPNTAYTFKVRARDGAGNWSPISDPFVATTPAADPADKTPPTMPPGLSGGLVDETEVMMTWNDSTDNVTPAQFIRYDLFVNGVYDGSTVGIYPKRFSSYMTRGILNLIEVFATDEAGNRSAPATMTIDMR